MENEPAKQPEKKIDPKDRQLTIEEYRALQAKESKKFKGIKLPFIAKIILALPLIAVALFGIIAIPILAIRGCAPADPSETVEEQ